MLIRLAGRPLLWRHFLLWTALLIALALPAFGQQPQETLAAALERIKLSLDQVETALKGEHISAQTLNDLRGNIIGAREELRAKIEELEPQSAEIAARLKQLGQAPAADAPPEDAAVATEREQLTQNFSQVDGALKQARLLAVRTEQLSERISERRRALYARELLQRGPSVLDPTFWAETGTALMSELRSLWVALENWGRTIAEAGAARIAPAVLLLLLILGAAVAITRWWLPRFDAGPRSDTRFARARTALWVFIWLAARTPLAVFAAVMVLEAFGLFTARMLEIAESVTAAVLVSAFGRGVARGLLAPDKPERRIVDIDDHTAQCVHDHLVWGTRLLGVTIVLQVIHKTLYAPLVLTVATNALFGLAIAVLGVHLIRYLRRAEIAAETELVSRAPGLRLVAWAVGIAIVCALVAGFAALGAFIALRAVVAVAVIGALYLLANVTDTLFTEALAPDTQRGRTIAANVGVNPRNVGIVGALLSAAIRVMLALLALVLILGPWEISTADLNESLQSLPLGFRIGEISISFRAILIAVTVLCVVLLVTRIGQRWLQRDFLPRTSMEPSLQLSIATIFGYVGGITAIALAMGSLGIDLQKIAFVASALAVGIGFGLQSIVSNFVSGLILLAERPIRVGDSIVVKGEEGWVRRIRVRATEIETYDRASVIIPNSELITGMVKNWTHANTLGRIIVKVGVGYDSDPAQVLAILMQAAQDHPQIVRSPPPGAFMVAFGDSALDFELRCVTANMADGFSVKSDLQVAILQKFREAGISIPYPQREIRMLAAGGAEPVQASVR